MSDVTVSLGLDLSLAGSGDFFTIGATPLGGTAIVGALPLAGDVNTDVTSYVRSVSLRRGRSKETEKFDAGRATVVLDNRARTFDPAYLPTSATRTNLATNPSLETATTGWTATSVTSDDAEAEALLASATLWLDANYASSSQTVPNLGSGGTALDATLGSTGGADSNDPKWLPYEGTPYVYLPGVSGNYLSTPDAAALDITGDIDIRVKVALDDWTPSAAKVLLAKRTFASSALAAYEFFILTTGILRFQWYDSGTAGFRTVDATAATGLTDGAVKWCRATLDADNGAGGNDVKFWLSDDGTTWTQLGTTVTTATVAAIQATASAVEVGSRDSGASGSAAGKFYRAIIYSDLTSTTKVLDVDTSVITSGAANSFTATTGQTVTINRSTSGRKSVAVVGNCWLLGTDDYMEVADNALLDFDADDDFTVLAVMRRWHSTDYDTLVSKNLDTQYGVGWMLRAGQSSSTTSFIMNDGTISWGTTVTSPAYTLGNLVTACAVMNGSTGRVDVYQGASANGSSPSVGSFESATALRIGTTGGWSHFADAEIVAVAVFRSALTAAQISAISTYYSGRAAYSTAAPTRSTATAKSGAYSGAFANAAGFDTLGIVYASAAVTAGTAYVAAVQVTGTTATCRAVLDWHGASGYISRSQGDTAAGSTTDWTRYIVTGTAPVGATSVHVRLDMPANATTPVYADALIVEAGTTAGTYFDGSIPAGGAIVSDVWTGTAHASTSVQTYYVEGTGSQYAPSLKLRKAVTIDADGQRLYTGQIEDFNLDYTVGGDSTNAIVAADGFMLLAGRTLTGGTATQQATGARLGAVLSDAMVDWPLARRDIAAGQATVGADVVEAGTNALAYAQQVAASEPGSLFIDRNGLLAFRDRAALQAPTTTTFADDGTGIPFTAIARNTGTELLWTEVSVTYTGGTATASATTAQTDYGIEVLNWPTLLSDDDQAQDLADFWAGRYSAPTDRIDGLEVVVGENLTATQRGAVLALELGDLVTVTFTPNGIGDAITQTLSIEAIEHEITDGATRHTVRLNLSQTISGFIIGQSLLGQAVIGF